jgi:hypothetical protein
MTKTYIGIDIGKKGAIAVVNENSIDTFPMPMLKDEVDKGSLFFILATNSPENTHIIFEKLGVIYGSSKQTAFSMGYQMGLVEAFCVAMEIPYTAVRAVDWQKEMFKHTTVINKTGKTSKDTKAMALVTIKRLFPTLSLTYGKATKPHDGLVDAVLIAEYARKNNL